MRTQTQDQLDTLQSQIKTDSKFLESSQEAWRDKEIALENYKQKIFVSERRMRALSRIAHNLEDELISPERAASFVSRTIDASRRVLAKNTISTI